jgi:hypothetical protein
MSGDKGISLDFGSRRTRGGGLGPAANESIPLHLRLPAATAGIGQERW